MTTTQQYRLRRPGDVDLVFDGVLLADATSRDSTDQPRWAEVRIYRSNKGRYITETVGRSALEDEDDRVTIRVVDAADQLRDALKRKDSRAGTEWLTNLAVEALEAAGAQDEAIAATLSEEV